MDLIGQLAGTLGVDSSKAEGAAGAILGVIKQHAPPGALDGLAQSAPQMAGWIDKAGPLLASGGGLLGGSGAGALGALGLSLIHIWFAHSEQ